jgi:hypothetical protein
VNEGVNISPRGKLHPWGQTSPLGANFTPVGKLTLLKLASDPLPPKKSSFDTKRYLLRFMQVRQVVKDFVVKSKDNSKRPSDNEAAKFRLKETLFRERSGPRLLQSEMEEILQVKNHAG